MIHTKYCVEPGKKVELSKWPTDDTGPFKDKNEAKEVTKKNLKRLIELQEELYASSSHAILIVLQAMDAGGKDGAIEHVFSGVNPQGCNVTSFKVPSHLEASHDFLWRHARCLPERGHIGIFNRSYYEEVLVVRVHEDILEQEKLPAACAGKHIWKERLADIAHFERYLSHQGLIVLKFFLHVSRGEQKKRFLDRLDRQRGPLRPVNPLRRHDLAVLPDRDNRLPLFGRFRRGARVCACRPNRSASRHRGRV